MLRRWVFVTPNSGHAASTPVTIRNCMSGNFYCGDNLEILTEAVPPESVDLVYLDPPFNSQQTYNIVYKGSTAQAEAFKDYWSWEEAAPAYAKLLEAASTPAKLKTLLRGLRDLLIDDDADLLAYITMMAPRLFALHRVLKATGSLYLHCDPTASHYLKLVLDAVFGAHRHQNEVIWKRTTAHSSAKRYAPVHDTLLFYSKGDTFTWNSPRTAYAQEYLDKYYRFDDGDGRLYWRADLTAAGVRNGSSGKPWRGVDPAAMGRHWALDAAAREIVGDVDTIEALERLDKAGRIYWPPRGTKPQYKRYRDELKGKPVTDIWDDIDRINPVGSERVGYPTQKPLDLLIRIIEASSNPGDLVLDPFCGCGTTIEACEQRERRWIGIDIAARAVAITEGRFKKQGWELPEVRWYPPDRDAAVALAGRPNGGTKFEAWALRKIQAAKLRKRDRGIDGEAFFRDPTDGRTTHVLVSVKSGKLNPAMVRELRGTIERERGPIGVLVTLHEPSKEMKLEATRAGYMQVHDAEGPIPRLQIVTVDRIFSDLPAIRAPGRNETQMPKPTVPESSPRSERGQLMLDLEPKTKAKPVSKAKDTATTRLGVGETPKPKPRPPMKAKPASEAEARRRSSLPPANTDRPSSSRASGRGK